MIRAGLAAILLGAAAPASATVLAVSDAGAVIEHVADVALPPPRLWPLLLTPARWWSPAHSWSGDAHNLRIDARAGGCFCEALADGGSVEHLRVVYVDPGKLLRMTGGLGPLQADAATGPLTITLASSATGTRMTWRYAFAGVTRMPFPVLAPIVDRVLGEQVVRLKALAEEGVPGVPASSRGTASPPK